MDNWLELVRKSKTIALFAHINSDGDANGSVMAMKHLLDGMGKETYVFLPLPINESYWFLGANKVSCVKSLASYDLAIGLDCPNTNRFSQCKTEFFKAKASINIDHHMDNENFANINIVDVDSSSACEILYHLFKEANLTITKDMATALYSGIATDSGNFTHGPHTNVDAQTFRAVADLVDLGADLKTINTNLITGIRRPVFELYRRGLCAAEFFENGKIAIICLTKQMFIESGAILNDANRIKDALGSVDGVEISCVIGQNKPKENYVSVRTKNLSAERICKHFGGGGHLHASGCRIYKPLEIAKNELLEECKKELNRQDD